MQFEYQSFNQICVLQKFSQFVACLFIFLTVSFDFNEVRLSFFFFPPSFHDLILYLKSHYQTQLYLGFSDVVFQEFYSFCFTVTSVIHFGLIFFFFCMQLSTYSSTIFKKLVFITVQLICNVVSVSTIQQSESVIYMNHLSTLRFFSHLSHYRVLSRLP